MSAERPVVMHASDVVTNGSTGRPTGGDPTDVPADRASAAVDATTSVPAHLLAALSGLLFGAGLAVSGMTKPSKVIGFLDLAGEWDPSLAFVMMGAVAVHAVLYRLIRRRSSPLLSARFHLPTRTDLDARLLIGAAIFGVGWGLGGLCPGPGLVAAASGESTALVFALGMTAGILAEHAISRRRAV